MKNRFLCAPHRLKISTDANKAIYAFNNSYETAQTLGDLNQNKDAISFAGCAFETAEIILTTKAMTPQKSCEVFTRSAVLFANICSKAGYTDQALEIYWMSIHRLEKELSLTQKSQPWLQQHLEFFYQSIQLADFSLGEADLSPLFTVIKTTRILH